MPLFIRLANLTDQGIKNIKNLPKMLEEAKNIMAENDTKLVNAYTTLGRYDLVAIIEAPDSKTAAKVSALIASKGNFRAETLAAIPVQEFMAAVKNS